MPDRPPTTQEYLDGLAPQARAELEPVLARVRAAMPDGFIESIEYGMIAWSVPLADYPDTYNGRPLQYAALAAQKRHNSLYLLGAYAGGGDRIDEQALRRRWSGAKDLDMGKSCVRFRRAADLDLDLIAESLGEWTAADFIEHARAARR